MESISRGKEMVCKNCGNKLRRGAKFCPVCGVEVKKDDKSNLLHKHEIKIEKASQKNPSEKDTSSYASGKLSLGMRVLFSSLCTIMVILAVIIVVLRIDSKRPFGEYRFLSASMENMESDNESDNAEFIAESESTEINRTAEAAITEATTEELNTAEDTTEKLTTAEPKPSETELMVESFLESPEEFPQESVIESASSKLLMSPSEIEEEVQRIKDVWTKDREAVENGSFTSESIDSNTIIYSQDGDVRMIEISGNENELLTKILQVENGNLTFAYYGTEQGKTRCYFKDNQLFRWIQTDIGGSQVIHDLEQENPEFIQYEQQIINEFRRIFDHR